jgi:hypothetical protein
MEKEEQGQREYEGMDAVLRERAERETMLMESEEHYVRCIQAALDAIQKQLAEQQELEESRVRHIKQQWGWAIAQVLKRLQYTKMRKKREMTAMAMTEQLFVFYVVFELSETHQVTLVEVRIFPSLHAD